MGSLIRDENKRATLPLECVTVAKLLSLVDRKQRRSNTWREITAPLSNITFWICPSLSLMHISVSYLLLKKSVHVLVCLYLLVMPDAPHCLTTLNHLPAWYFSFPWLTGCLIGWWRSLGRTNSTRPKIISLTPTPVRIAAICWPAFNDRLRQVNVFPSQQTTSEIENNSCCCCCSWKKWNLIIKIHEKKSTIYM